MDHVDLVQEMAEQFGPVLERSPDGVYLWLDEEHKVCNEKLARMFGYTVAEWSAAAPFLDTFIDEEDQEFYSWNYHNRIAAFAFPVTFRFRGKRKDGTTFMAETDMVPISFRGHAVAYHFVRQVGA